MSVYIAGTQVLPSCSAQYVQRVCVCVCRVSCSTCVRVRFRRCGQLPPRISSTATTLPTIPVCFWRPNSLPTWVIFWLSLQGIVHICIIVYLPLPLFICLMFCYIRNSLVTIDLQILEFLPNVERKNWPLLIEFNIQTGSHPCWILIRKGFQQISTIVIHVAKLL